MTSCNDLWSDRLGNDDTWSGELYPVLSLSAAELAFHWPQIRSPRGLRVQPSMQTLKTFCLPFLGWRGRPLKDDLLCTSANLVCM